MRTYQDRLALTRSLLGTRIRIRICQKHDEEDFARWIREDMPLEIYSIVSCVFADQFGEYSTPETEKKIKAFADRISEYVKVSGQFIDSVEAFITTELDDMHVWCRDIADTMYSRIDTDNYTFVW
jgi:hypothetical protein